MSRENRKAQIIEMYSQGVPTSEIANKLRISEHEVVTALIKAHKIKD